MAKVPPKATAAPDCPQCGDVMAEHRAATDAEFAAAMNKESPGTLPTRVDTAAPNQRATLGALFECRTCGYQTRVKPTAGAAAADESAA